MDFSFGGESTFHAFTIKELRIDVEVNGGETVTLQLKSETQFHTFTAEELGIDVEFNAGETVELTHTFDKVGTYELICIPHQSLGMTGTITVR